MQVDVEKMKKKRNRVVITTAEKGEKPCDCTNFAQTNLKIGSLSLDCSDSQFLGITVNFQSFLA